MMWSCEMIGTDTINGDLRIRVRWTPCWLLRRLGYSSIEDSFRGGGTVWHSYPSGIRASSSTEAWLSDISQAAEWENEK